jgi:hypothetical protein
VFKHYSLGFNWSRSMWDSRVFMHLLVNRSPSRVVGGASLWWRFRVAGLGSDFTPPQPLDYSFNNADAHQTINCERPISFMTDVIFYLI